jgi:NADPH:quinone reductase-like Zn-dependent oxidoreductase
MRAALVSAFDVPPTCRDVAVPEPKGPDEEVVHVLAAGLHPRVRSQANGSHYTSTDELPLVPGIDGVGRSADGRMRYFVLADTRNGSMAEQVVVDRRRTIVLPDDADPVVLAAAMNPAMSSWVALRRRVPDARRERVLVLGATGNAGGLAVQVARHLGARHIVAVGRDEARLAASAADRTVCLDDADALAEAAADVDVVLDYVWGEATAAALRAIVPARADDRQPLTWVQIGSVAGPESPIPSAALRATRLSIVGSGQGSVAASDIVAELEELVAEVGRGTFAVDAVARPLEEVEAAWTEDVAGGERLVVVPAERSEGDR